MYALYTYFYTTQEFKNIYRINVSQISSLKVDKLADLLARILKKTSNMDEASIIDEYVAMVNISRNVSFIDVETPKTTEGKSTNGIRTNNTNDKISNLRLKNSNFREFEPSTSRSQLTMLNVPDLYQSHTRLASTSRSQSTRLGTNNGGDRHGSIEDSQDDYCYHLMVGAPTDDDNRSGEPMSNP